jgi:hypothetical protein
VRSTRWGLGRTGEEIRCKEKERKKKRKKIGKEKHRKDIMGILLFPTGLLAPPIT